MSITDMTKKKKIGILNMRYDNNYGGNLQRYALVKVLQDMGYDVTYLYIRDNWGEWFVGRSWMNIVEKELKQIVRHLLYPKKEPWLVWHREKEEYKRLSAITEPFLDKYVKHTRPICSKWELKWIFRIGHYDAIIVGSDQVWRKQYVGRYGLGTWFFDFVPNSFKGRRIVYGASFGVNEQEYSLEEQDFLRPLFNRLDAVSVRESSGLDLLKTYGWTNPSAIIVLDPTLLLQKEDYEVIIDAAETHPLDGTMFCYILDRSEEKLNKINEIAKERKLKPIIRTISDEPFLSVEQWLRNIRDAKFVITDSYHGLLFSIIFEKEYYLFENESRGNARFESVMSILSILKEKKQESIEFIRNALL